MDINELLTFSFKNKDSDLHLSAGLPPMLRVHGDVKRIDLPALAHRDVQQLIYATMNDAQRKIYDATFECDFSFDLKGVARFRVNAFVQNRGAAAVFRTIPAKVLTLDELKAPPVFKEIASAPRGLVLVTGPTGSGKSTTLAAMINHINEHEFGHILTIEDPIEFVHEPKRCLINQREVGPQTHSFANALRASLREDPDIILVGEMRDLETIQLALRAAETGHLVFGTLHTSSAAKTINRIIDVFPAADKDMIRSMLAESLHSVIAQSLLKTKDGTGRIAVHEILSSTSAIKNHIRMDKVPAIYSAMQAGAKDGMTTLEQALQKAVQENKVTREEARKFAREESKDDFR